MNVLLTDVKKILNKKIKQSRPFVHRGGYHACISHYAGGSGDVNRFSGTCLNRQIKINEKIRLQDQAQAITEIKKRNLHKFGIIPPAVKEVSAWSYPGLSGAAQKNKLRAKRKD
ncbi:MAG TPA: hypothetical protein VGG71_10720, partial [Chitinophagaceae bacterium]